MSRRVSAQDTQIYSRVVKQLKETGQPMTAEQLGYDLPTITRISKQSNSLFVERKEAGETYFSLYFLGMREEAQNKWQSLYGERIPEHRTISILTSSELDSLSLTGDGLYSTIKDIAELSDKRGNDDT